MNTAKTNREVQAAIDDRRPVLALESTIVTHGMPWPQNFETALQVQQEVRDSGAVPACCAIIDGHLRAGLDDAELETLAQLGTNAHKASRRDIPFLVSQGASAGTTVAATMIIADRAGIKVFATGGIGGVHRGVEQTMDVSADLQELARTNVAVVCSGAKSILDIPRTLEYLETMGVAVVGFGTDELPAFFSATSGYQVNYRMDSEQDIAEVLHAKWSMGIEGGVVIANPIPDAFGMDRDYMEKITSQAVAEAQDRGISGKDLTPFLLARVEELTSGDSLASNIQLILNNARLGARIAAAYSKLPDIKVPK